MPKPSFGKSVKVKDWESEKSKVGKEGKQKPKALHEK